MYIIKKTGQGHSREHHIAKHVLSSDWALHKIPDVVISSVLETVNY